MSRDNIIYWIPYVVAISVVVFSTYFMWKALFADRARGRRRCPKCWYDLAYTEGMTCNECGYVAQKESVFVSTRRHYGRASIALTVCVVTILGAYWKLTERGFIASLPTGVLIMAMPIVGDASSGVFTHLSRRLSMNQISDQHMSKIIERCVAGDWMVDPPEDDWVHKYGVFLDPIRQQLPARRNGLELDAMEKGLLDVPARVDFDTREVWPAGSRARVRVRARDWWPVGYELKLHITPHGHPEQARSLIQRPNRGGSNAYIMMTDPLDTSIKEVGYDVEVFRRRADTDETVETEWVSMSTQTVRLPLRITKSLDDAIEAVQDEELDKAMQRVFGGVTRWTGGPQPVRFNINYQATTTELFNDVAIGVSVDLLHDGEVARQLDLWWRGGTGVEFRGAGHEVPFEDVPLLLSITQEDLEDHWVLRVRSDPEIAFRAGDVNRYWKGEFTINIGNLNARNNDVDPKPRNWWIEEGADEAEGEVAR